MQIRLQCCPGVCGLHPDSQVALLVALVMGIGIACPLLSWMVTGPVWVTTSALPWF